MNKTAKEMFEELGYELLSEHSYYIGRKSWNYNDKDLTYFHKQHRKVVKINTMYGFVSTIEFGCGDDDDRQHQLTVNLHKAIHQQMKELGWLE